MSVVPSSVIKTYAESIGLTNLGDDILTALAQDVEYRTRELIQDAMKHMHNSKRTRLSVADINNTLEQRCVERLYGYDSNEKLSFRLVPNTNIFFVPRDEVDLEAFASAPLPKAAPPLTLTSHWLAVDGVQPEIPENVLLPQSLVSDTISGVPSNGGGVRPHQTSDSNIGGRLKTIQEDAEIKGLVRHLLSKELQDYYDAVIGDLSSGVEERIRAALYSTATDAGLQQLVPYFVQYIAETVPQSLRSLGTLRILVGLLSSLLANEHLFLEPYLHQIMPTLLSCLLGKRLCENPTMEDHWTLRDRCSVIISDVCRRFGSAYATLLPRCAKTMGKTLLDTNRNACCHYGALIGISALGPRLIEIFIIANAESLHEKYSLINLEIIGAPSSLRAPDDDKMVIEDEIEQTPNLGSKDSSEKTLQEPINKLEDSPKEIEKCAAALARAISLWLADTSNPVDEERIGARVSEVKRLFSL